MSFHAIIPAGGAGTRLWPLSRKGHPKFLSDLTGAGRSLLQQTVDRLGDMPGQVTVVTSAQNAEAVASQVPGAQILIEPQPRGTMGAIGLAAAIAAVQDADAVIGSFAADHLIADEEAFRAALRTAIAAAEAGYVATIGITPDGPSTAYGYIEAAEALDLPEGQSAGADGGPEEGQGADASGFEAEAQGAAAFGLAEAASQGAKAGGINADAGGFEPAAGGFEPGAGGIEDGESQASAESTLPPDFESEPEYAVETPPPAEYFDDRGHLIGVAFGYNPYVGQSNEDEWDSGAEDAGREADPGYQGTPVYQNDLGYQDYQENVGDQGVLGYQDDQGYQYDAGFQNDAGYQGAQGYQDDAGFHEAQGYHDNPGYQDDPAYGEGRGFTDDPYSLGGGFGGGNAASFEQILAGESVPGYGGAHGPARGEHSLARHEHGMVGGDAAPAGAGLGSADFAVANAWPESPVRAEQDFLMTAGPGLAGAAGAMGEDFSPAWPASAAESQAAGSWDAAGKPNGQAAAAQALANGAQVDAAQAGPAAAAGPQALAGTPQVPAVAAHIDAAHAQAAPQVQAEALAQPAAQDERVAQDDPAAHGEPGRFAVHLAAAFVEKPDEETAASYLATGNYLWNAGMFVAKASVLMDALERFHPEVAWPLREIASAWQTPARDAVVARHWVGMPSLVIDTAIAEPLASEGGIAVVPAEMGWSDIGDFDSLAEVIDEEVRTRQAVPGASAQPVIAESSPGALVYAGGKPIAVVGIPGAVVVDMDDVLLVTTREAAQQVKGAVDALPGKGLSDLA